MKSNFLKAKIPFIIMALLLCMQAHSKTAGIYQVNGDWLETQMIINEMQIDTDSNNLYFRLEKVEHTCLTEDENGTCEDYTDRSYFLTAIVSRDFINKLGLTFPEFLSLYAKSRPKIYCGIKEAKVAPQVSCTEFSIAL